MQSNIMLFFCFVSIFVFVPAIASTESHIFTENFISLVERISSYKFLPLECELNSLYSILNEFFIFPLENHSKNSTQKCRCYDWLFHVRKTLVKSNSKKNTQTNQTNRESQWWKEGFTTVSNNYSRNEHERFQTTRQSSMKCASKYVQIKQQ